MKGPPYRKPLLSLLRYQPYQPYHWTSAYSGNGDHQLEMHKWETAEGNLRLKLFLSDFFVSYWLLRNAFVISKPQDKTISFLFDFKKLKDIYMDNSLFFQKAQTYCPRVISTIINVRYMNEIRVRTSIQRLMKLKKRSLSRRVWKTPQINEYCDYIIINLYIHNDNQPEPVMRTIVSYLIVIGRVNQRIDFVNHFKIFNTTWA